MSSINIPASRVQQIEAVLTEFVYNFNKPLDSPAATEKFLSVYHPDIEWFDHAFLMRRVGHQAVIGLQKSFTHCNRPFSPEIKAIHPTAKGAMLEQVWHGRCANDIVRPDGQVVVKANGKDFVCHVCMAVEADESGKITKIDEYYNRIWEDGIPQMKYTVLQGASMKEADSSSSL